MKVKVKWLEIVEIIKLHFPLFSWDLHHLMKTYSQENLENHLEV